MRDTIYPFLFSALLIISACETKTTTKKPELSKHEQWVDSSFNSWTSYVLIVNLPDSSSKYNKKYFRKALAYSIDREKLFKQLTDLLADYPLDSNGNYLGGAGIHGFVPPAFAEYNIQTIKGYSLNEDSAKYYFKKSKFFINKIKGKFEIYKGPNDTGIDYMPIANINMDLVKCLGLPYANTNVVTRATRNQHAFSGEEGIYVMPIAKCEKPEAYLALFYSKNKSNSYIDTIQSAYINPVFDAYYEAGLNASNRGEAIKNFQAAEQILIDDAVVIPLFYSKFIY